MHPLQPAKLILLYRWDVEPSLPACSHTSDPAAWTDLHILKDVHNHTSTHTAVCTALAHIPVGPSLCIVWACWHCCSTHLKGHKKTGQAAVVVFSSGFWEKAMPREQSSPLSTCWLGMTGCPRSAKSLTFSASEQRMNFVITLLMFFPDAQRTGRNQVKSVSGQEKFSLSSPSSKGNFVGEKRVLPCPYEILANSASNSTERTSCSRFFSILDCAPSPVCSPPENI